MFISFIIALILFLIAYNILKSITTYSENDYEIVKKYNWADSELIKKLKEGAVPTVPLKLPLWIWLGIIISYLIPILNIIAGINYIVALILLVTISNNKDNYKYNPGKIIKFLTKKV